MKPLLALLLLISCEASGQKKFVRPNHKITVKYKLVSENGITSDHRQTFSIELNEYSKSDSVDIKLSDVITDKIDTIISDPLGLPGWQIGMKVFRSGNKMIARCYFRNVSNQFKQLQDAKILSDSV